MTHSTVAPRGGLAPGRTAFLFDLDGTLVDSVYQHVLAWHEAMRKVGIKLAVWTIHRRIGMSGGLMANAILYETGHADGFVDQVPGKQWESEGKNAFRDAAISKPRPPRRLPM